MFSINFPYEKTEEVRVYFVSINYTSFGGGIIVKVSAKNAEKSVSYELFVEQSQYLNWDKQLVFQKEIAVDKYLLEKNGKEGAEVDTTGKIILSDTAVVVESPKFKDSNAYDFIYTSDEGAKAYMSSSFIGAFPKDFSIKDKWFQIMLD